ncbi:hypothetical protein [Pseudomonas sp. TE3610]
MGRNKALRVNPCRSMMAVFIGLSDRQRVKVFAWTASSFLVIGLVLVLFFQERAISKSAPLIPATGVIWKSLGASDDDRTILRFLLKVEPGSASRQVFAPLSASGTRCGARRLSVGETVRLSVEVRGDDFTIRAAANTAGCILFDDAVAEQVRLGRQQLLRTYAAYFFGLSVLSFLFAFWYWRKG